MRSHAQIISDAKPDALAEALSLSVNTVRAWRQRNSIPAEHWKALEEMQAATLGELAEAAARERAA